MTIGYQRIRTRSLLTVWLGEPRLDDDRVDRPAPATGDVLDPLVQDFVILFTESVLMLMGCCLRQSCLPGIPIEAWRCRSRPSERTAYRCQISPRCQLRSFSRSPAAPAIESLVIRQAVSMTSIVKSALDAFSAAAGTGVSTRAGHPATVVRRLTAPGATSGPPGPRRAVPSATPSLARPAGSNPMPDNAACNISSGPQ
jgi:hypothetical protein